MQETIVCNVFVFMCLCRDEAELQRLNKQRTELLLRLKFAAVNDVQCSSQRVRRDIKYDVDRYMTPSAKKHVDTMSMVIDWHIANLEYANATTIDKLDAAQWDQVRMR